MPARNLASNRFLALFQQLDGVSLLSVSTALAAAYTLKQLVIVEYVA